MNKLSNSIHKAIDRAKYGAAVAALAIANPTVFAANNGNIADHSDISLNSTLQNLTKLLFNIMLFGGILSLAYGVVQLFKAFTSGDSDPHAMSKGVGFVIGGLAMIAIRVIVQAIIGSDPTTLEYAG